MSEPLVSVGLQFYNNETTLHLAIQSILSQSYENLELLLHNDGSQDRSLEIAASFRDPRIRLFSSDANLKRPTRLNESLQLARGKYYAVMDGDDISYPQRLARQVEYLEENPTIDLLGTGMMVIDSRGNPVGKRQLPQTDDAIRRRPWTGLPMAQPTFMGKTEWFRKHWYNERAVRVEDQDLLLRAYLTSQFANLPDLLVGYRTVRLQISKIVAGRYALCRSLSRQFYRQRRADLIVRALAGQGLKAVVDVLAISTGLNYRILRHRARPITQEERREWQRVWAAVNHQVCHHSNIKV